MENLYFQGIEKLRRGVSKVFLLIVLLSLIFLFSKFIFIPLAREVQPIYGIQVSHLINVISIIFISTLISLTFKEIVEVSNGLANLTAYFLNLRKVSSINKLRRSYLAIIYVLFASYLFVLLKELIENINPALPGILLILIVIFSFLAFYITIYTLLVETEINIPLIKRSKRKK